MGKWLIGLGASVLCVNIACYFIGAAIWAVVSPGWGDESAGTMAPFVLRALTLGLLAWTGIFIGLLPLLWMIEQEIHRKVKKGSG